MIALRAFALLLLSTLSLVLPGTALAQDPTGGAPAPMPTPKSAVPAHVVVAGAVAKLLPDGSAAAPALAPAEVQQAIWAANTIQRKPYVYGGGHGAFKARGYDCSGTVSFALHAAGLLDTPLDSGSFMSWGDHGRGEWITVYTNPGHAYAVIAGLRLDTSAAGVSRAASGARAIQSGPRWRPTGRTSRGYKVRHPLGF